MSNPTAKPTGGLVAAPAQTTFLGNLGNAIKLFWSHDMAPWLIGLWHMISLDVLQVLVPEIEKNLGQLDQALLTQGPAGALMLFDALLPGALQKAEALAAGATLHDVITAVSGVIAKAQTAATTAAS